MSRMTARFLLVAGTGALAMFFAVAHARIVAPTPYDPFGTFRFPWTVVMVGIYLASAYAFGLPEVPRSRATAVLASAGSTLAAVVAASVGQLALGSPLLPRFTIAGMALTLPAWALLSWHAGRDTSDRTAARVLVIARSDERAALEADLQASVEQPAVIVGELEPSEAVGEVSRPEPILDAVRRTGANLVVLDASSQLDPRVVNQAAIAHAEGVRVRTLAMFAEEFLGKISVNELERVSLLFDIGELHRTQFTRIKRLVDVGIGAVGVLVLAFLVPSVAIGNLFGNRGPLFYSQTRVGRGGSTFTIYKFRSMTEGVGSAWTTEDDQRVTPFGRLLRATHLDEMPQVWNILVGDLSLVGPRPEQPHYVTELEEKIPFYGVRHLVRPGLTGWAQVKYRYGASESDAREKLQFDLYYLRRQSLVLDSRILVRTLRAVFMGGGR